MEQIQIKVNENYINNIKYLERKHKDLYEKIRLFEQALELNLIEERYILEYKNFYFDVYDNLNNLWVYNTDSEKYSEEFIESINFDAKTNSFKTFYDYKYDENIFTYTKEASILSDSIIGNAPVIHYINKNLPKIETLNKIYNYIIFGVILGLHIPKIHKKLNCKIYHIIEESLELFRLSLFVVDYSEIANFSEINFYIANSEEEFYGRIGKAYHQTLIFNHYIKFTIFSKNNQKYIDVIQDILVMQSHYLYAYPRELMSLNRTYNYLNQEFNFINISQVNNLNNIQDIPILILGAGPSLNKEIDFLKRNQKRFIIVAVYSIMEYLEKNNIVPDIITQYDEGDDYVMHSLRQVKDLDFFSNTIFLFSSHVVQRLMNSFNKKNIFIFQAIFEAKKGFGILTSPSIGEISYALTILLGFKKIYLLGIDLSFDPDTNNSHYDANYNGKYSINDINNINKKENNYSFRESVIKVKGNLISEVYTIPIFKVSIKHFNIFTNKYKNIENLNIYNLSNGAYLDEIKPLNSIDFNTKENKLLSKNNVHSKLQELLCSISSNINLEIDILINRKKIEDALIIKQKVFYFSKIKNPNIYSFKNELLDLYGEVFKKYNCNDLQQILKNYFHNTAHYVFYFFNLERITNPKRHIKQIQKIFSNQINKIIDEYIRTIN